MTDKARLEEMAHEIGTRIANALDDATDGDNDQPLGFALLIFDFYGKGNLAWISNAQRQDMVRALGEFMEKAGVA